MLSNAALILFTVLQAAAADDSRLLLEAKQEYRIAILQDDLPGHDPALAERLAEELNSHNYPVTAIDARMLGDSSVVSRDRFDLLVLPCSGLLPMDSFTVIESFIAQGGDVFALGTPAFTDPLWRSDGAWMGESDWRKRLEALPTENVIFDFERENLSHWTRHTNTPNSPSSRELADGHTGKALHAVVDKLAGWDTLAPPDPSARFPRDHTLTTFYAKGVGKTRALSLEWRERDGSRWIAVFPVSEEWRRVVLTPSDFKYWESTPNRGSPDDRFNPANAASLAIGVAWSHTGPRGGKYEYFIDEFGTAKNPYGDAPESMRNPPVIEGLSPSYKFYSLSDVARVQSRAPFPGGNESLPVPPTLRAHHPRPTGKGFGRGRSWRWIPLLEAIGSRGEWRGAPASLSIDCDGPNRTSIRASYAVDAPEWCQTAPVLRNIADTVDRMARGVFFWEAGAEAYTIRAGETAQLGATVANLSRTDAADLRVVFELTPKDGSQAVRTELESFGLRAGQSKTLTCSVLPSGSDQEYQLTAWLFESGTPIDAIRHELAVFEPKPESERVFMTARDGDFYFGDKKWYAHGVNYMPSTGIGVNDQDYFENWIGSRAYDPEFIQRDLERCRDMGLNSVSIFIHYKSVSADNLLDILRRCENLGFKVNLSIRPGTPMSYNWQEWRETIEHYKLWEIDTIFTYDIAWEPFFGTENQRRRYDADWRRWIVECHGSIEAAESSWGVPVPRHQGQISTPIRKHLGQDGPHRKMVADYRRFVDTVIHERYQSAYNKIRAVDPHHLISFRMTVTGDPTFDGSEKMPYDFQSVARSMDFMAPEGYGRIGDWERVKPGRFTVDYARACAPGKPVLWAEAGVHVWDPQGMHVDPERLAFQGTYFEDFYRMVLESNSSGIYWWWYPGGYRTNERSDYGIINPDGTDRPSTRAIRRHAARVLKERDIPKPDRVIEIDRDADARGLYGIYECVRDEYWQVIEAGGNPGLRLVHQPE